MIARLRDMMFTSNGRQILSLDLEGDFREDFDKFKDKLLDVDVKIHRVKRSKNANDYLWVLCDKIAQDQGIGAVEVYRKEIEEVGVYTDVSIPGSTVERFAAEWSRKGLGWFCKVVDDDFLVGCKRVRCYYGSSTYNVQEMSRLINATVEDARALGIETATPAELALLLTEWETKK